MSPSRLLIPNASGLAIRATNTRTNADLPHRAQFVVSLPLDTHVSVKMAQKPAMPHEGCIIGWDYPSPNYCQHYGRYAVEVMR